MNIEELKKIISGIIDSRYDSEKFPVNKDTVKRMFSELADYNHEMLTMLEKKVLSENIESYTMDMGGDSSDDSVSRQKIWNVCTALKKIINGDELKGTGWDFILKTTQKYKYLPSSIHENNTPADIVISKPVFANGQYYIGTGYLDCRLGEIDSICGREYSGMNGDREFRYRLVLSPKLVYAENFLTDIADMYEVGLPVIYAPMSRRFVHIVTSERLDDNSGISLETEKNGIQDKLLLNYRSVWNVSKDDVKPNCIRGNVMEFKTDKDEYIRVNEYDDYNKIQKMFTVDGNTVTVSSEHRRLSFSKVAFSKLNDSECKYIFKLPEIKRSDFIPPRVRSKCDIEKVLVPFRGLGLETAGIYPEKPENARVCEYTKRYSYPERRRDYLSISDKKVWVIFKETGDIFLDDAVIFAVHCLRRSYPEFEWKGGVECDGRQ